MCPDNFPKTLDNEREPPPGTFTPWHDQKPTKPRYESRLIRNLSLMNSNIRPQSVIEQIDVSANAPWDDTSFIDIQIPLGPKDIIAQKHREKHSLTHANPEHLCFYSDGSLLDNKAGTGIYASRGGVIVHESEYYLGTEAEVFDAELYGIMKATEIATRITRDENITDVCTFCDNQCAV